MTDATLEYYRANSEAFSEGTFKVDFSQTQEKFLKLLPKNAAVLDLGCGSGRDSLSFLRRGFRVTAADGSPEMCRIAAQNTGLPVKTLLFDDLDFKDEFDGIWACASILHLSREPLKTVLGKIERALVSGGILYTSFKYGEFSGMRNGRFFTDFTYETFREFLREACNLRICEYWISRDVRPGRDEEKWLNLLMRKE